MQGIQFLLLFLTTNIIIEATNPCPDKVTTITKDISGILVQGSSKGSFCEAAKQCATCGDKYGQILFVTGRNYIQLERQFPLGPGRSMWTSINSKLINVGANKVGWRDGDPRRPDRSTLGEDDVQWAVDQPQGKEWFTGYFSNGLHDMPSVIGSSTVQTCCESAGDKPKRAWVQLFKQNFPQTLESMFEKVGDPESCMDVLDGDLTMIDCTRQCALNSQCRSMYFDMGTKKCVHMLYVDAKLPSNFPSVFNPTPNLIRMAKSQFQLNQRKAVPTRS